MIDFILGIVVGSAFAPFWMKVWELIKAKYREFKTKEKVH